VQASGNRCSRDARYFLIQFEYRTSDHPGNREILHRNEIELIYESSTQLVCCISSLVRNPSVQFGQSLRASTLSFGIRLTSFNRLTRFVDALGRF
jgi:hypothetical protein